MPRRYAVIQVESDETSANARIMCGLRLDSLSEDLRNDKEFALELRAAVDAGEEGLAIRWALSIVETSR